MKDMTTSETPGVEATPDDDRGPDSTGRHLAKAAAGTALALTRGPLIAGFTAGRSAFRLGREVMAKRAAARGDTSGKMSTGTVVAVALGATVVGVGVAAVVLARRNESTPPADAPPSLREVSVPEPALNGSGPATGTPAAATTAAVTTATAESTPTAAEPTVEEGIEPVIDEVVTVEDSTTAAPEEAETAQPQAETVAPEHTYPEPTVAETVEVEDPAAPLGDPAAPFEDPAAPLEESAPLDAVDTEVLEAVDPVETPAEAAPYPAAEDAPPHDVTAFPSTNGLPAGADRSEG